MPKAAAMAAMATTTARTHRQDKTPAPSLSAGDVVRIPRAFSRSECEQIIALTGPLRQHTDEFLSFGEVRGASAVCWLETANAPSWLVERVTGLLAAAAREFDFDISAPLEDFKLIKYRCGNRVAWHVDCAGGLTSTRKLTLTVLLSAPATFGGGELTVAGCAQDLHRNIGDVVIFPSFLAHKVTTVTRGTRHTLVVWAHGTRFR